MSAASTALPPASSLTTAGEISETELAWLAGLLEGEGSFYMARCHVGGKLYLYPKITLSMTDQDVIEHAARLLGNNGIYPIPRQPDRKQAYRAGVSGWKAADLMRELRSRTGERRRAKINAILAEYEAQEPTTVRRSRACAAFAATRTHRPDGTFEPTPG